MGRQADIVVDELDKLVADQFRKLVLDVHANLVEATPVDTGWARSNWVPSIGSPVEATYGSRDAVTSSAQAAGVAEIVALGKLEPAWVSNNVPYIRKLNDGHSAQAGPQFVEGAIARAVTANK